MNEVILHDIKNLNKIDLSKKYKIQINQDGTVFDYKHKILFISLMHWGNEIDFYRNYAILF